MFGDMPIVIPISFKNTKFPTVEGKMRTLIRNWEEALAAHKLAQNRMVDRRRSTFTPFQLGDRVWLDSRNLKMNHNTKISPQWEGPFKITNVIRPVMYQLELPCSWRIHNLFHATLLQWYKETDVYGGKFPQTNPRIDRRRGSLWSWIYYKAQKKRVWLPILCEMERLPQFRGIVETGGSAFRWRRPTDSVQRVTPTLINLLLSCIANGILEQLTALDVEQEQLKLIICCVANDTFVNFWNSAKI